MSKSENKYRRNSKGEWEERTPRTGRGRTARGEYANAGRDERRGGFKDSRGDFSKRENADRRADYSRRERSDSRGDYAKHDRYDERAKYAKHDSFESFDAHNDERAFYGEKSENVIIGRNPVMEALKSGRTIDKLVVAKGAEGSIVKIVGMAKDKGIPVMYSEKIGLDRIAGGGSHQGIAAYVSNYEYVELDDILDRARERGEDPFLIILDNIEDPHNLGAIMRTAETAGAHGIVIPKRRAVGLTETVAKASAGAIEYMPVAKVVNIAQTIDSLKEQGIWVAACDMGEHMYWEQNLTGPIALVVGAEGEGISRLVREKCDYVVSIPMLGNINSLNASNAASILIYEICKQRLLKK